MVEQDPGQGKSMARALSRSDLTSPRKRILDKVGFQVGVTRERPVINKFHRFDPGDSAANWTRERGSQEGIVELDNNQPS